MHLENCLKYCEPEYIWVPNVSFEFTKSQINLEFHIM